MESSVDSKTLDAETLAAVSNILERLGYLMIGIRELASTGAEGDALRIPAMHMAERGVQMVDACLGALDGSGHPTIGNFDPATEIADEITRIKEARVKRQSMRARDDDGEVA